MYNNYRGYQAVIGIEIHVQLNTKSKLFCSDATKFNSGDNENISPVSVGMPGTLPVLNKKAVEYAVKTGLALNCQIREKSVFARKNYFYPDLPKGYQISQFDEPICENGFIEIIVEGIPKKINIVRAHLEEDAGKSTHLGDCTLLNYNRAGIALLEIVSAPELNSPVEASEYAKEIRQIVRYLDVCDGNLEEGSMRCDCNVSVRKVGESKLGTKVELKNINSFRFVEKAIEYEIDRQIDSIDRGDKIIQETRLYDPDKNRTFSMRTKEDAHDYRYFPDPDLLPIVVSKNDIHKLNSEIPELPQSKIKRFQEQHGLPLYDAQVLSEDRELADYYERTIEDCKNFKAVSNWIMTDVLRELKTNNGDIKSSPVTPKFLAKLINLIDEGKISGKIAKTVFLEMWESPKDPEIIINEKGLLQISDLSTIEKIIEKVIASNLKMVEDYKSGKTKVFGFFVGAVMKETQGKASPEVVNKILTEKLQK